MPSVNLVTLDSYATLSEAEAAKRLEAAGIPTYLRGEATALIASDSGRAPVRIEVPEDDLEHARSVLAAPPGAAPPRRTAPAASEAGEINASREDLATVELFHDSLEAMHAAKLLSAHGIPCGLQVQGAPSGILPGLFAEVFMIRLEVHERDLERAFEALGFIIEQETGEPESGSEDATPQSERITRARPGRSQQIERPPLVQLSSEKPEQEPETPPGADEDDLRPISLPPTTVEAGLGGGVDWSLILLVLLGGSVIGLIALFLSRPAL